jgi:hypothetical protein
MKRAISVCLVFIALTAIHCLAAEPAAESKAVPKEKPSPKAAADTPQPVIPERTLTFDISEEEQPMPFSAADPELLEQRYVATFQLVGASRPRLAVFGSLAPGATDGYRAAVDNHGFLLSSRPARMTGLVRKSVLTEMPQERLPSEDVVALLAKQGSLYFGCSPRSDPEGTDDKWTIHFSIVAPTPERAKELVQGVLSFYDYGVFYPLQKGALTLKRAYEKRLEEDRASLKEVEAGLPALEKQLEGLEEYADITSEALVSFVTQQRLISVDMRGVKARIDACNKILAGIPSQSRRREQLETLKITAEIELVGLAARKEAIEEIVKKGGQRKELSGKLAQANAKVGSLEGEVSSILAGITHYEAELKNCMPYPVKDGKVVIRRIKWVSPGRRESAPPEPPPPSRRGS